MGNVDSEFIRQINVKQVSGYRELFERFYSYMVLYAMRRVQQKEVAEDIVQEVFITIWEGSKVFNSYHGFRTYLYDLVNNKCLDYLKHKAVEERYVIYMMENQNEGEDGEYGLMKEEIYRELYIAVSELPDRCREVFELHLQGKKNDEIAVLLSLSVQTVKAHKRNAMCFLKERLGTVLFLALLFKLI